MGGASWIREPPFPDLHSQLQWYSSALKGGCQHPHGGTISLTNSLILRRTSPAHPLTFLPNTEGQSWRKQIGKEVPGGQEVWTIPKEHAVTIAEVTAEEPSVLCCINPYIISCYLTWSSQRHRERGVPARAASSQERAHKSVHCKTVCFAATYSSHPHGCFFALISLVNHPDWLCSKIITKKPN